MISFNLNLKKINFNFNRVKKLTEIMKIEILTASAAACDKYVPHRDGLLRLSQRKDYSNFTISWNEPYAYAQYHGNFNHSKVKNPLATKEWDRVMVKNDLPNILRQAVKKAFPKGGF